MNFLAHALRSRRASFGPFKVHRASRVLTGPNGTQVLEPEVIELLFLLVDNAGEPVWREEILERLWPRQVVGQDALGRCVAKLRQALGDDPSAPQYIETLMKGDLSAGIPTGVRLRFPTRWGFAIGLALAFSAAMYVILWAARWMAT